MIGVSSSHTAMGMVESRLWSGSDGLVCWARRAWISARMAVFQWEWKEMYRSSQEAGIEY
jgi:hypothetical protein